MQKRQTNATAGTPWHPYTATLPVSAMFRALEVAMEIVVIVTWPLCRRMCTLSNLKPFGKACASIRCRVRSAAVANFRSHVSSRHWNTCRPQVLAM